MTETHGKSGFPRLVLIILILLVGLAGLVSAGGFLLLLGNGGSQDVPIIKAEATAYKERPEEPGGLQIDHQNSSVMTILEKLDPADETIDRLQLPEAEPELPPVRLAENAAGQETKPPASPPAESKNQDGQSAPADKMAVKKAADDEAPEKDAPAKDTPAKDTPAKDTPAKDTPAAKSGAVSAAGQEEAKAGDANQPDTNQPGVTAAPAPRPAIPKQAARSPDKARIITKPVVTDPNKPQMMVQLAAFRKQEKAEQAAAILGRDHKDRLNGSELGVMQIDAGSSGIFWRVITPALAPQDARQICDRLKRAGQDCILRRVTQTSP
jgi:hypothetical protein